MGQSKDTRKDLLAWVDIETTGLEYEREVILEVGITLTDPTGYIMDSWSSLVLDRGLLHRPYGEIDPYVYEMHVKSGLWDDIDQLKKFGEEPWFSHSPAEVSGRATDWLAGKRIEPGTVEMCGSSIHFDRGFLAHHMPLLDSFFHYRNMDVSTLMVACMKLNPELAEKFEKQHGNHRPLDDIKASIYTYKWMIDNFLHTTV